MKRGKLVYKDKNSLKKMHAFYDRTPASLGVPLFREVHRHFILQDALSVPAERA